MCWPVCWPATTLTRPRCGWLGIGRSARPRAVTDPRLPQHHCVLCGQAMSGRGRWGVRTVPHLRGGVQPGKSGWTPPLRRGVSGAPHRPRPAPRPARGESTPVTARSLSMRVRIFHTDDLSSAYFSDGPGTGLREVFAYDEPDPAPGGPESD